MAHLTTWKMIGMVPRISPYPRQDHSRDFIPLSQYPQVATADQIKQKARDIARHNGRAVKTDAIKVIPEIYRRLKQKDDGSGLHLSTGRGLHLTETTTQALRDGGIKDCFDAIHLNPGFPSPGWKKRVAGRYALQGSYLLVDNDFEASIETVQLNNELFDGEPHVRYVLFENRYPGVSWKNLAKLAGVSIPDTIVPVRDWQDVADYINDLTAK